VTAAEHKVWAKYIEAERERLCIEPRATEHRVERAMIHYTQLPEDTSGGRGSAEWNLYRREVSRLLAEGHEGKWVLLQCEQIIGIWDTEAQARAVAVERYLMQPIVIRQVREREPLLRTPTFLYR
jgi:hypothetical protein